MRPRAETGSERKAPSAGLFVDGVGPELVRSQQKGPTRLRCCHLSGPTHNFQTRSHI